MFGRILSIEMFTQDGNSVYLIDPTQDDKLQCSGTIEYLPTSSGAPRATIEIYNLPELVACEVFAPIMFIDKEAKTEDDKVKTVSKLIKISFGYKDENDGQLNTIFVGTIARAFTTRLDSTTSVTRIYAYQVQDFYTSSISSAYFDSGATVYDVIEGLLTHSYPSSLREDVVIPEDLKKITIDSPVSFYGKTIDCINSVLNKKIKLPNSDTEIDINYMVAIDPSGLSFAKIRPDESNIDIVMLADFDAESGKVVARSGLIGVPTMDTDGMRFETLINPNIKLYSFVWLPNSAISDNTTGFPGEVSTQYGSGYDPAGLYRVTKMTTYFDSYGGNCKTTYIAAMAALGSTYYK